MLGAEASVFDANSLESAHYRIKPGELVELGVLGHPGVDLTMCRRGWLRRVAPASWRRGTPMDSIAAAELGAWLALLGGIVRTVCDQWLTHPDLLAPAENKLFQLHTARRLGIPVPATLLTADWRQVAREFGSPVVVKPLGPSHFDDGNEVRVFFASTFDVDDPALSALRGAPFLAQEMLRAKRHWRVVTVRDRVWSAQLDASEAPLDWRRDALAHQSFVGSQLPSHIASGAARLAGELNLGYSSQDWVETGDDRWAFLDLNPNGQWLFLPADIGSDVAFEIAAWLAGRG